MREYVMAEKVSIDECRSLLRASGHTLTDAEIETMRDELERTADALFDQMVAGGRAGLEAARWDSYRRETGEGE